MDDRQILELFRARSEQALHELTGKYGTYCTRLAKRYLQDPRDAEECISDAWLGVWNTIPPQNPDPLLTYVCRIVRNQALKKYHAGTARKRNSQYDEALEELEDCFPSSGSVEEELSDREIGTILNGFLETLDSENRILFVRRYWYAESVPELAESFHLSRHAVTLRLSRIREKLKQTLIQKGVSL